MKTHNTQSCLLRRVTRMAVPTLAAVLLAACAQEVRAQSYSLNDSWSLLPGTANIDAANNNRGLAASAISNQVFVVNKTGPVIDVFDGTAGTLIGTVSNGTGIIAGGTFLVGKLGVADDGVLYAADLTTSISFSGGSYYKVYSWSNWNVPPYLAYASTNAADAVNTNLNARRIGDTFTVSGSGASTRMLAGIGSSNYFALLTTTDGINFTSTVLVVPGLPTPGSGVQFGMAFYTNNTFMILPDSANKLYLVQYPANFASLPNPVTATVIATNTLNVNWADLSYNSAAGLLAVHGNAAAPITLFTLPANNFASLTQVAGTNLSFSTSQSLNGNETGEAALGGAGRTNSIFTLDTSAGVQASPIVFTPAAVAPTITAPLPVGGTIYTADPSFSLAVTATGSVPFSYQWQLGGTSNALTATNIPGATNSSFTLTFPSTNASGWYDVIVTNSSGAATSAPVLVSVLAPVTNALVHKLWNIPVGTQIYADNNNGSRGIAYDPLTTNVVISDHLTTNIYVLDANTGSNKFDFNSTALNLPSLGVTQGFFPLNLVGVADDGVLYFGSLYLPGDPDYYLYSFSSVSSNAAPFQAFAGDPGAGSGDRFGDTMAVRGSGANTQILLGSRSGLIVALLTTTDGQNFSATQLAPPGVSAGFAGLGIAFGAGNTFWAKSYGFDLRQISFDPNNITPPAVLFDYVTPTQFPNFATGIGVDASNNVIGAVNIGDSPNDLGLFELTGATNAPILFDQEFFPSFNLNGNNTAAVAVGNGRMYALDTDNGIIGISYSVPSILSPFSVSATYINGVGLVLTWPSLASHTYQVRSRSDITSGTWSNVGSPITATGTTTSFTNSSPSGTLFYDVVGQ